MPAVKLKLMDEGDGCWPDLIDNPNVINAMGDSVIEIAALRGGMQSGKTSVAFRVNLPDGKILLFETSYSLLKTACDAIGVRHGGW
jgi:hypothetical protein